MNRRVEHRGAAGPLCDLAERIVGQLQQLVVSVVEQYGLLRDDVHHIDLHLPVAMRGGTAGRSDSGEPSAGADLLAQVHERLRELDVAAGAVPQGRVCCFQCDRADCIHAAPPDGRHVFYAYTPTGKPEWREFTAACLDWQPDRVAELYEEPYGIVAVGREGHELTADLLSGFGKEAAHYQLLGQVAAGYLPLHAGPGGRFERGALTFQVVATRWDRRGWLLHLNVIGPSNQVGQRPGYPEWWDRQAFRDIIRATRQHLAVVQLRGVRRPGAARHHQALLEDAAAPVLARLRTAIERTFRPQPHRTQHARQRQFEGTRPTSAAVRDALEASDDRLLEDPENRTIIVLGHHHRVHVFSPAGRHVTSLQQPREATERHVGQGRWQPLAAEPRKAFRNALQRLKRPER